MDCGLKLIQGGDLQLLGGGVLEFINHAYCQIDPNEKRGGGKPSKRRVDATQGFENFAFADDSAVRKRRRLRAEALLMVLLR